MITAVDTNILLDILVPNERFYEASAGALERAAGEGSIVIMLDPRRPNRLERTREGLILPASIEVRKIQRQKHGSLWGRLPKVANLRRVENPPICAD